LYAENRYKNCTHMYHKIDTVVRQLVSGCTLWYTQAASALRLQGKTKEAIIT
jgi:hypothetical protein